VVGQLSVRLESDSVQDDIRIRGLQLSHGQSSRLVTHFHYTTWPDFGVPKNTSSLRTLIHLSLPQHQVNDPLGVHEIPPIIVHCSAGVGRAGTFIVLHQRQKAW